MKDKLKLIKDKEPLKEVNNFWRVCPRLLQKMPDSNCPKGEPIKDSAGRIKEEPECPWWINSEQHNYCFWKYVKDKSNEDGVMKELVQTELAELFGWSNTKTHFILKEALAELKEALKEHGGQEMVSAIGDDDFTEEGALLDDIDPDINPFE